MWLTVLDSCLCRLAPRRSGTSSVIVWVPNKRATKVWGRVMCSSCTAVLVVVTRNACSGRKWPWVVVWWWEQGALAKGAAVMQELHLVKSTSFCSSSLILYHLFIPSLLFPLVLGFAPGVDGGASERWGLLLPPGGAVAPCALWPPSLTLADSTGCSYRGEGIISMKARPRNQKEIIKVTTHLLTYVCDSCHSISSCVSENCEWAKRRNGCH